MRKHGRCAYCFDNRAMMLLSAGFGQTAHSRGRQSAQQGLVFVFGAAWDVDHLFLGGSGKLASISEHKGNYKSQHDINKL